MDFICQKYKNFLKHNYIDNYKNFCRIEKTRPESARAEAVIFSLLKSEKFEIVPENASQGGCDFLCKSVNNEFFVEVAALQTETVVKHSGWKLDVPASSFGMITGLIRRTVKNKAAQIKKSNNISKPIVLAITTEHLGGDFFMGKIGTEYVLTSDTKIMVMVNSSDENIKLSTDFANSIFFKFSKIKNIVEPVRQHISAVVLVHILGDMCAVCGILHPEPVFKFSANLLPTVPFVGVKNWPINKGVIEAEWNMLNPAPAMFAYKHFNV